MYILTIDGKEKDGAYSVQDDEGNHVLYLLKKKMMQVVMPCC